MGMPDCRTEPAMVAAGPEPGGIDLPRALALLAEGEMAVERRLPWSSNGTWLVRLDTGEASARAVYKPRRAERPLWDFPAGTLCLREVASFVVSAALGWDLVPPTVLRAGPLGLGSVQLFIPHDPDCHYLAIDRPDPTVVRRLVALDVVINNADRKSGHVLVDAGGRLWAIDHGVTFHAERKLRTVIWDFAGESMPEGIATDLGAFVALLDDGVGTPEKPLGPDPAVLLGSPVTPTGVQASQGDPRAVLRALLAPAEIEALRRRARALIRKGRFPGIDPHHRMVPWPVV